MAMERGGGEGVGGRGRGQHYQDFQLSKPVTVHPRSVVFAFHVSILRGSDKVVGAFAQPLVYCIRAGFFTCFTGSFVPCILNISVFTDCSTDC